MPLKSTSNGWPAGQNGGEKRARASGTACNGRPAGRISQASSRVRAGPRYFFSLKPNQNDVVLVGFQRKKIKEKGWSSRWASNGYFQPSIADSRGSRCPTATWAINIFFSFFLFVEVVYICLNCVYFSYLSQKNFIPLSQKLCVFSEYFAQEIASKIL